ncbi:MAG TPA: ion channel [Flavipsychrobacter sp.]|nr:ion channel [Flavipsychrobacter sp.]
MKRQRSLQNIPNTGFGANSGAEGGRLTNKDGSINLRKTGLPFWERISLYHSLLRMPRAKFLLSIFLFYGCLNLVFAFVYMLIGVDHLLGVDGTQMAGFFQAFFFSSQTLTTVGYGHISPDGLVTNTIASLESFFGILSFAMVTGLLYGRFTRPKAYLLFSKNAIIAPHKGVTALMFRTATYKNNHLTEVEAQLTIAFHVNEEGKKVTRFYPLNLEISKVNSLALSWTVVHLIDEESPLYQMSEEEMKQSDIEILVFMKGFDDHFSNIVQQRTSYTFEEIVYGAKFIPMFKRSEDQQATILELNRINEFEKVPLPTSVLQR